MRGFDDVTFNWAGESYKIPAHRVLGAIARVEDVITLHELQRYSNKNSTPLAKISMAYGALLRYAGAKISDVEIYEAMFGEGTNVKPEDIVESVVTLIAMMVPPVAQKTKESQAKGKVKPAATKQKS